MKSATAVRLFLVPLVLALTGNCEAGSYVFTRIAPTTVAAPPAINSEGKVAFIDCHPHGCEILVGDGGPLTTIAAGLGSVGTFWINDTGTVAFASGNSVLTGNGGPVTTIIADGSTVDGQSISPAAPSINDSAVIAFWGRGAAGFNVIATAHNGQFATIADQILFDVIAPSPFINNTGDVAFFASQDKGFSFGAYVGNGNAVTTIAGGNAAEPFSVIRSGGPSANNDRTVVFAAQRGALSGIFTGNGGDLATIADTNGAFSSFGNSSSILFGRFDSFPAINNSGTVAFQAVAGSGAHGLFTGPDPLEDKIVASGDALDSSTIAVRTGNPAEGIPVPPIQFARGLNDTGQVAFTAILTNGTIGVYRADPVIIVGIEIKPGGGVPVVINLAAGGNIPVAILSSATFDARTVDPATVRFAGAGVAQRPNGTLRASIDDVNGDGLPDLVVHVTTTAIQLSRTDTIAVLTGKTVAGVGIRGAESVRIVRSGR